MLLYFFFFSSRRRHTRCSRDWSSDVCSSDLLRSVSPSCRRLGSTRGSFPKLNAGGAAKQAVLNHWFSLEPPLPEADVLHPATTFGLKVPIPNAESALDPPSEIFRGKPR